MDYHARRPKPPVRNRDLLPTVRPVAAPARKRQRLAILLVLVSIPLAIILALLAVRLTPHDDKPALIRTRCRVCSEPIYVPESDRYGTNRFQVYQCPVCGNPQFVGELLRGVGR